MTDNGVTPETIDLLGSWKLLRVEYLDPNDRQQVIRQETDGTGFIHYMSNGRVAMVMASADHKPVAGDDRSSLSEKEQAQCFRNFGAYCGTFTRKGNQVIHHLDFNNFPNEMHDDYVRRIEVSHNDLALVPIDKNGHAANARLVWRRL